MRALALPLLLSLLLLPLFFLSFYQGLLKGTP